MMEEEAKSASFLREESHVSKGCGACLSLRSLVGLLAVFNVIFGCFLGFTFYMVLDLKQQVKQLNSNANLKNGATQPFKYAPYSNRSVELPKQNVEGTVLSNGRPTQSSKRPRLGDRREGKEKSNENARTSMVVSGKHEFNLLEFHTSICAEISTAMLWFDTQKRGFNGRLNLEGLTLKYWHPLH